jgi:hypothetical protein
MDNSDQIYKFIDEQNRDRIKEDIQNGFLAHQYSSIGSIAVLVDRMSNNQAYVYLCMQMRKYYETNASPDIQTYVVYPEPPFEFPVAGLYELNQLTDYTGLMLPTSLTTLNIALQQWRSTFNHFYVYDINELFNQEFSRIMPELVKRKIVLIPRSPDHGRCIKESFPALVGLVSDDHVPDFNMERLMKLIWQRK